MSKKELVANRQYTDEFMVESVRLGESIGGNKAAKRLGIPESSLWNWIRLSRAGKLKAAYGAAVSIYRYPLIPFRNQHSNSQKELPNSFLFCPSHILSQPTIATISSSSGRPYGMMMPWK